jgi:hypothetical protein
MTQSEVLAEIAADEAKLKPYWTVPEPARARLLLKAPELLTELRSVISAYGDKTWGTAYAMDRALSSARALIAEIEGGGTDREEYPDHGPTDPWQTSGPGGKS